MPILIIPAGIENDLHCRNRFAAFLSFLFANIRVYFHQMMHNNGLFLILENHLIMARVPTWTELRLDAARLNQLQKQCYLCVHKLLDVDIPELDNKILSLNNGSKDRVPKIEERNEEKEFTRDKEVPIQIIETQEKERLSQEKVRSYQEQARLNQERERLNQQIEKDKWNQRREEERLHLQIEEERWNKKREADRLHLQREEERWNRQIEEERWNRQKEEERWNRQKEEERLEQQREKEKVNLPIKKVNHLREKVIHSQEEQEEELEHLKSLPLPLSYYLRRNRPELVMRAENRLCYIKNKSERRKELASTRIINSLEQIRLSSRSSSSSNQLVTKRDYLAPKYQVECMLSEHEMKRLTAKTYKRLPEVKKRQREEISNHMKVQNYKNKMEYGRRLLENRRHGIINYPLRS